MKIVMLGQKHTFSREGGVEVVVKELATRMVSRGHKVVCFDRKTKHVSGAILDTQIDTKGVKVVPVWSIDRKGLAALTSSISASWKASRSKADVVHIHAEGPAAMAWLPKLFHKKVVVTVHGLDWQRTEKWGWLGQRYIRFGEKVAVKFADEIIVLSRGLQDYFRNEHGRETVFIPNGVSRPEIREAQSIKKQWGLEKDSYVLFLGRIVPEKGLRYLVRAWKEIDTDKKLVIAGGASDTQAFINELKAICVGDDRIIFTGFQSGKVLEELYSNSYIYCLPSDLEGMPLSLLEAMSYGNCCLVSDIPECAEVVESKAALFEKGNTNELKRLLQELMNSPEKVQKYKTGATDYITQKYNWDDVVSRTLELYR